MQRRIGMANEMSSERTTSDAFKEIRKLVHYLSSASPVAALVPKSRLSDVVEELKGKGVSEDEIGVLVAAAQEAAEIELRLQQQFKDLASRVEEVGSHTQESNAALQVELERLAKEVAAKPVSTQSTHRIKWFTILMYPSALLLLIGVTAILVAQRLAGTPTVAINYEVGSIVQGALAGIGALVAGSAYAAKILNETDSKRGE
jgi:TolA-binding protein